MSKRKEPDFFSDREIQEQGLYYSSSRINSLTKYNSLFSDWIDESIIESRLFHICFILMFLKE